MVLLFIANFLKGSLQDELDQCFQAIFKLDVAVRFVTRSALSQARRKISHHAFVELLDVITNFVSRYAPLVTYHGMRVFAIDGSTFRMPNRPEFVNTFGETRTPKTRRAMGRLSIFHDILNRITYDAILDSYHHGETTLAYKHLEEAEIPTGSLIILDRGYVNFPLLRTILHDGHHFCIRLKSNLRILKHFRTMGVEDAVLSYKPSKKEIRDFGPDSFFTKTLKVRLIRYRIGKEEYTLMTSLINGQKHPALDLFDLYHQRWEVEESYKLKKCRLRIEDVTGLTPEIIRQDFHAKVFAEALAAAFALELQEDVTRYSLRTINEYKVSITQVVAKMKNTLVLLFVRDKPHFILSGLLKLIQKSLVECVPGRRYKRRHPGKNARKIQTQSMCYRYNR